MMLCLEVYLISYHIAVMGVSETVPWCCWTENVQLLIQFFRQLIKNFRAYKHYKTLLKVDLLLIITGAALRSMDNIHVRKL